MRRRKKQNKNMVFLLIILLILGISIAYAILTEQLTINNTVSYDAMKWDVGFTIVEDGFDEVIEYHIKMFEEQQGATLEELNLTREEFINFVFNDEVIVFATAAISSDKKSIIIDCELEMSSKKQNCYVKATITNDSTFDIKLSENPTIIYNEQYIDYFYLGWWKHSLYENETDVFAGQVLPSGETAELMFVITTSILTEDMLPSNELSLPVTITLDFEETDS